MTFIKSINAALSHLRRNVSKQDGNATIEFVIWFPFFMMLFFTSFELSFYGMRSMMLERAVDLAVRDFRIGAVRPDNGEGFRNQICNYSMLKYNCTNELTVDLQRIDNTSWVLPTGPIDCVNKITGYRKPEEFTAGAGGDLMMLRVCVKRDPFFASTPFVMGLPRDDAGSVNIIAVSTFVNEP